MELKYLKYFFLSLIILMFSCTDKITESDNNIIIDDFPNSIGDYWVYIITDSSGTNYINIDTVKVTIVDSIEINENEYAMVWVYDYDDYIATQYVSIKSDTVIIYYNLSSPIILKYFVLPFEVGDSWGISSDTSYIVEQTSIITPAGEFDNSYRIKRQNYSFNYFLDSDTWFVNKIGIVAREIYEMDLGPFVHSKWELLEYDVRY